jgi:myo-inositol-1(or 4)-monophosphatase
LNGQAIHVSEQADLKKSMLFTYLPKTAKDVVRLAPLFDIAYRVRGHASHNIGYCWVAKGGYDAHFSLFTPQPWWDIAAGILILREAGGKVTDLNGAEINQNTYKVDAVGSNGKIHNQLLEAGRDLF